MQVQEEHADRHHLEQVPAWNYLDVRQQCSCRPTNFPEWRTNTFWPKMQQRHIYSLCCCINIWILELFLEHKYLVSVVLIYQYWSIHNQNIIRPTMNLDWRRSNVVVWDCLLRARNHMARFKGSIQVFKTWKSKAVSKFRGCVLKRPNLKAP